MDPLMDVIKNSEEPEWLEKSVVGGLRLWQILFLCLAGVACLIVMVCCCFRFRIPRTKQQIEADYQRRKITCEFRQQLETIQDAKMDAMSLQDALDLLHEKSSPSMDNGNQQESAPSSIVSPQQSSLEASFPAAGGATGGAREAGGLSFVKFASKVAALTKLGQPAARASAHNNNNNNTLDF